MAATAKSIRLGPAILNIAGIRAGDANQIAMQVKSGGTPIDLTDQTLTAQAREEPSSLSADIDGVITMVDELLGKFILAWPGDDVTALLDGRETYKGVWDLQMTADGIVNFTIVAGTFEAEWDVTRP